MLAALFGAASALAEVDAECLAVEQHFALNQTDALEALTLTQPHWQAHRDFRLAAAYIPQGRAKDARRVIRRGLKIAKQAIKAQPDSAELLLLGAMLDGQYVLLDRWRFVSNGWRGIRRINRAEKLAPDSPRAALIRGTAKVVLPGVLGGDAKNATELLEAAIRPDALCADGEWGQVDLLRWLGRAYDKQNDSKSALAAYQQALSRSPDNHWVIQAMNGNGYQWPPEET